MPAKGRRAAALDSAHHLELEKAHVTAVGVAPRGAVVAEDVRDFQRRTALVRKRSRVTSRSLNL
jgi:hypothetical protein